VLYEEIIRIHSGVSYFSVTGASRLQWPFQGEEGVQMMAQIEEQFVPRVCSRSLRLLFKREVGAKEMLPPSPTELWS